MANVGLVFDESGNVGDSKSRESYAIAGVIYRANRLKALHDLDARLRELFATGDYKYSHLRVSIPARRLLRSGLQAAGVSLLCIASYQGGIAAEQERFDSAAGERQPVRERRQNLEYFTDFVAQASYTACYQAGGPANVWWDRRSDMPVIASRFDEANKNLQRVPDTCRAADPATVKSLVAMKKAGHSLSFLGACGHSEKPVARLAGLIAGDILAVLADQHAVVASLLKSGGRPETLRHVREFRQIGSFHCGAIPEPLARGSELLTDKPAFRAYAPFLCSSMFSFIEQDGRVGHLRRELGQWHVLQLPD